MTGDDGSDRPPSMEVTSSTQDRQRGGFGEGETTVARLQSKPKVRPSAARRRVVNRIPEDIQNNKLLDQTIEANFPPNYNLEIKKTVWKVRQSGARKVALQFPEGLMMFATSVAEVLRAFASIADVIILGDVTYGACCIDDFAARAAGAEFLVHYGHSCLVPTTITKIPSLYVFVEIGIDNEHLIATIRKNVPKTERLGLLGTIQFVGALHAAKKALMDEYDAIVPQAKPLSPGEVLGCTSPKFPDRDTILYIADGRFHLESIMIANPHLRALKYDPFTKELSAEAYDHLAMRRLRSTAIEKAKKATKWGVILGALGRQGNPAVMERLVNRLKAQGKEYTIVILSEIFPAKLRLMSDIEAWVQIACPRLSIDWGHYFDVPLLSPYELTLALEHGDKSSSGSPTSASKTSSSAADGSAAPGNWSVWAAKGQVKGDYPMDFYAKDGGIWSNYYREPVET